MSTKLSLVAMVSVWLCLDVPVATAQTTIMAIGDRITQGSNGFASYRYPLWFMLRDAGHDVDFVGTRTQAEFGVIPSANTYPHYETTFDRDHEASGLVRSDVVVASATDGIDTLAPDIALVMVGALDIHDLGAQGITNTTSWARAAINRLRNANPDVTVMLGGMYPANFRGGGLIPNLNAGLSALADEMSTGASPVIYVDHHSNFDVNTLVDASHVANVAGERELAERWFAALQDVLPEPTQGTAFELNPGLNDAWFNPATDGQGFFINLFPDVGAMFVGWFTFETMLPGGMATVGAPEHRWLTAIGTWEGNLATLDVFLTTDGIFDDPQPVTVSAAESYGTLTIEFHDCATATLTYDLFAIGLSGMIPIQRIVPDNNSLCEALQPGPGAGS